MLRLHDSQTAKTIDWGKIREGEYVKSYFLPMMEEGVENYIENVKTTVYLLEVDDLVLPVTINEREFENSYVCSPYTHYISYAKEELWELKNPVLETIALKVIDFMGALLKKTTINRVVVVNNWFLSTNLYFPLSESQIEKITGYLTKLYPTHTLMFRSLNKRLHSQMVTAFEKQQYQKIMTRSVYLFMPEHFRGLNNKQRKEFLSDENLYKKSDYTVLDSEVVDDSCIPVIMDLYNQLYIDKYSEYNPKFTTEFYRNAIKNNLLTFKVLRDNKGQFDGVVGYFKRNHVLTTPILGYDLKKQKKKGLYRILSLLISYEVLNNEYVGHFSAGAGDFKRNRGSVQEIEYSYYYNVHLPLSQKLAWNFLKLIMDKIVEPMALKKKF